MGDFDFLKAEWPKIASNAARAESFVFTDPLVVCIYARRTTELVVSELYAVEQLPEPYRDDLAAKISAPDFKNLVPRTICDKLNLIRRYGNDAAHPNSRKLTPSEAAGCLDELFHVLIWFGLRYTTTPEAVPQGRNHVNLEAAKRATPVPRAQVADLVASFKKQDAERAAALEANESKASELEAELADLRAKLAEAQASQQTHDDHDYAEAETRTRFIDLQLHEAGWPLNDIRDREYPVTGMPNATGEGRVDYVLWGDDGLPLAVVEAKRTTKSDSVGQQQAKLYADCLEKQFGRRPVIFYTNGITTHLWDDLVYPPRPIQGFLTKDELELTIQRRTSRKPLAGRPVDHDIVERYYQERAIKAVDEAFDAKQRAALLVMATGSGKTRTAIALVKQLMDAGWVKRVLFLADRTALVKQAVGAFKAHLPSATTVNLVTDKITDGRVFASTYPTMLNIITGTGDGEATFGPGFFDLIIIDEAHRSVYAKYGAIFDYFDALLLGLTATPKDEVDHNTYRLFQLEDGVPTDAYDLEDAIKDGYLVPPTGFSVGTKFTRGGIRYVDLSPQEQDEWDALDWGDDGAPDEIGTEELNRFLFNKDTVDKVLGELMESGRKVDGGERTAKTIIFAKSQEHAEFIEERFNLGWPQYAGQYARIITHVSPYAQSLIDDFSETDKAPHIAISVDMLDTGIDVPDVANLVLFKMVRSKSKFWQMIGRGTRLRPDLYGPGQDKTDFLVLDYCGNLEYFGLGLPGTEGSLAKSLSQRIFEARLELIRALADEPDEHELRSDTISTLHDFVSGMTFDNVLVRPHWKTVEKFSKAETWQTLTDQDAREAAILAGLPTTAEVEKAAAKAKQFDLVILRRQVAQLTGDAAGAEKARQQIQQVAEILLTKANIPTVAAEAPLLESLTSDDWWADVTPSMLESVRKHIRGLMQLVESTKKVRLYTDFADETTEARAVALPGVTPGTDMERFRAKARSYLCAHEDNVALQRLLRNRPLTASDLEALEQMLVDAGAANAEIASASTTPGGLGVFVRSLVGLDRAAANEAFARFLDEGHYSVDQIRFIGLIVDELTANGVMPPTRLFEPPYTDVAPTGPDLFFPDEDVQAIVSILRSVQRNAEVPTGAQAS